MSIITQECSNGVKMMAHKDRDGIGLASLIPGKRGFELNAVRQEDIDSFCIAWLQERGWTLCGDASAITDHNGMDVDGALFHYADDSG